jgi:hypothetical protein
VQFEENSDDGFLIRVADARGYAVGIYEESTLRLDHFVSPEEFVGSYVNWTANGPGSGMILAPSDVTETGVVPRQPGGGEIPEADHVVQEILCQAKVSSNLADMPPPLATVMVPTPPPGTSRSVPAIHALFFVQSAKPPP